MFRDGNGSIPNVDDPVLEEAVGNVVADTTGKLVRRWSALGIAHQDQELAPKREAVIGFGVNGWRMHSHPLA